MSITPPISVLCWILWGFDDVDTDEALEMCRGAAAARGATWLTDDELRGVLHAFNLPLMASAVARTAGGAAARGLQFSACRESGSFKAIQAMTESRQSTGHAACDSRRY